MTSDGEAPPAAERPRRGLVLLTGGTGFVGSHVAEALAAAGYRLRCTVRETSDTRWLEPLQPALVRLDLGGASALDAALDRVETVAHVAGVTRAASPETFRRVNVEGTSRLAEAAVRAGVRRFVFLSSLAARGPDGAGAPTSEYGRSKRDAEDTLLSFGDRMEVVLLRPGGVYGPRDVDLVPLFRMASRGWVATPASDAPLQPVYVTDVAEATRLAVAGHGEMGPYPVAERGRYRWEDVARHLASALGRRVRRIPLPPWTYEAAGWLGQAVASVRGRPPDLDVRRARDLARHAWTCDVGPTEEALGWIPRVALPEGIRLTAAWYREAGWL